MLAQYLHLIVDPGIVGGFISANRSTQSDQNVGVIVYGQVVPAYFVACLSG
jgi:hypothetical protein